MFAVVARADWKDTRLPVSVLGGDAIDYDVAAFVQHRAAAGAPATQRMRSGHYVAHVKIEGQWLIFNDRKVAISQKPPLDLGYLYFYRRSA